MELIGLFPQPVIIFKMNDKLTAKELSFIKNQETKYNMGNTTSVDKSILANKQLTRLRDFIETSVDIYLKKVIDPKFDVRLKITQSWANYTEPGEWHHKHFHYNSFVSGVFYPQADKEIDKIHFFRSNINILNIPPENWNIFNSNSWWFPVGTGDLILFPSSLEHKVEPAEGTQTRISLSFNTFPVGCMGDPDQLTALNVDEQNSKLQLIR